MNVPNSGLVADASPSPLYNAHAWYLVALLTLLYALSFTDRLILALMAQPVASALKLSDGQLALLLGAGFAVVYAISGIPIADRIDRGNRIGIVAAGVAIWGTMTAASAFAGGFWSLLVFRAGVALGEAVLTPAAVSLIGDLFPPHKRALPTAIYGSMGSIMGTGAFILGGAVLAFSGTIDQQVGLAAWQLTFIILGVPGLILAAILLATTRDPRNIAAGSGPSLPAVSFGALLGYLRQNAVFYLPFYLGLALITIVSMGTISWMPTAIVRTFGGTVAEAGFRIGGVGLVAGVVAAIFWPSLVQRLARRGRPEGTLICLLASGILAVVSLAAGLAQHSETLALGGFFFAMIGLASVGVLAPLALQAYGPRAVRGRLAALYILATGLFGYAVGPVTVVALSHFWNGAMALRNGIILNALAAGALSAIAFMLALRASRRMPANVD